MNKQLISDKLQELVKAKIIELGLVKTGHMLNSIRVTYVNDSNINLNAVGYFQFLNEKYSIVASCVKSPEFISFVEKTVAADIRQRINNLNKSFKEE